MGIILWLDSCGCYRDLLSVLIKNDEMAFFYFSHHGLSVTFSEVDIPWTFYVQQENNMA